MNCQICGANMPERYVERAKRERGKLICPVCYHVVKDYGKKAES